jgi:LEA14-like dessication related protein
MSPARLPKIVLAAALGLAACTKPEPPTVKPISGRVTTVSPAGLDVEAKLEATNPNDFDILVKSYTATVKLDRRIEIGSMSSSQPITLPASKKKVIDVPISVKWNDVVALAPLALANRDVPWEAEGTVKVKAESLEVDLPFKVNGTLTHQQIVTAVGKSLPAIPLPF